MAHYCNRRTRQCNQCGHRYTKAEYELWICPECGHDRHCQQPVKIPGAACKHHGGASPKGVASPQFIHGRHSRYLPERIRERYLEALSDPELLNLSAEIALIDQRIGELVEIWQAGSQDDLLHLARAEFDRYIGAVEKGDEKQTATHIKKLRDLLYADAYLDKAAAWDQITELMDLRRKMAETQIKKDRALDFTLEDANLLIVFIQTSIIRYVSNPKERSALAQAIEAFAINGAGPGD